MKYTLLPLERSIDLSSKAVGEFGLLATISEWAGVSPESVSLFARDAPNGGMIGIASSHSNLEEVFILIHYRGGGKGGFRKQLEKKAREFARAKRKEKNTHKAADRSKSSPRKEQENVPVEPVKVVLPTQVQLSSSRQLARQGVNFIFSEYSS